jgi:hypothetical protein
VKTAIGTVERSKLAGELQAELESKKVFGS